MNLAAVTLTSWIALAGPVLALVGATGKALARKLDKVGEHLERQDRRGRRQERRLIRLETKAGLEPLRVDGEDE